MCEPFMWGATAKYEPYTHRGVVFCIFKNLKYFRMLVSNGTKTHTHLHTHSMYG